MRTLLGWGMCLVWLVLSSPVGAQEVLPAASIVDKTGPAQLLARMSVLESELGQLDTQKASYISGDAGCEGGDVCCGSPCGISCDPCCFCPGWLTGAELTFLKPYGLSDSFTSIDADLEAAVRTWIGYTARNGRGIRARWWTFNHGFEGRFDDGFAPADIHQSWDLDVVDLELTNRSPIGYHWNALLAGGLRYVHSDNSELLEFDGGGNVEAQYLNDGLGGTFALEVQRPYFWSISSFASIRGSILFGDKKAENGDFVGDLDQEDSLFAIWEAQAGFQWSREAMRNAKLFARLVGEMQYWDSPQLTFLDRREAMGFAGFSVSLGVTR